MQPELFREARADALIDSQCVGLAPAAIQGQHQLPGEPLARGVFGKKTFQFPDHHGMTAELQVGIDPDLQRHEPELLQATDLRLREVLS